MSELEKVVAEDSDLLTEEQRDRVTAARELSGMPVVHDLLSILDKTVARLEEERKRREEAEEEVYKYHAWTDSENCGHPGSEKCWIPAGVWGPRGHHSGNDDEAYLSEYACPICVRVHARRGGGEEER